MELLLLGCHLSKPTFCVPVKAPLDQKSSISSNPITKYQANSGLYTSLLLDLSK